MNHLVAIVKRIDAKKQLSAPATLGRHDAATLLAQQSDGPGED
jgi:hypothetical protein